MQSSPFIRTLGTTAMIAKELGIPTVDVNYCICEHLGDNTYKEDPLPSLEIKNQTSKYLNKKYNLQGVEFSEVKTAKNCPKYPESY